MRKIVALQVIAALVIGFLLAGAFTHITYSCVPSSGSAGCTSYDKALMHPADLLANKQNSLVRFLGYFAINSFFSFIIIDLIRQKGRKTKEKP